MSFTAFYDPGFAAPIGDHIMPMRKFGLVAEGLRSMADIHIGSPAPVTEDDLLRVHTPGYIAAIRTGEPRQLAESQKFPWSPWLYPSVLLTNGAVLAAGRRALGDGASAALASGFHHSCADHGEGFCTFNGLVVAAEALRAAGSLRTVAILDLDLHYGNGTASLAADRPWLSALSIYGSDYADNRAYNELVPPRHTDGPNHRSVAIPNGSKGADLRRLLSEHLPSLLAAGKPDLLLYQAGADPLRDDPYSPLDLGHEDLAERDRMVFRFARDHGVPVAWVLAGGYTPDVSRVVGVHLNTARACLEVFSGGS